MKEIPLTKGQFAIVDDADFDWLSRYSWISDTSGYAVRRYSRIPMHRMVSSPNREQEVDHMNGNKLDNQRANLRNCTRKENARNRKQNTGTSQYKGVYWEKAAKCWRADIRVDYKLRFLGRFPSEIDAARAYDAAARQYFGEFARLNFSQE